MRVISFLVAALIVQDKPEGPRKIEWSEVAYGKWDAADSRKAGFTAHRVKDIKAWEGHVKTYGLLMPTGPRLDFEKRIVLVLAPVNCDPHEVRVDSMEIKEGVLEVTYTIKETGKVGCALKAAVLCVQLQKPETKVEKIRFLEVKETVTGEKSHPAQVGEAK